MNIIYYTAQTDIVWYNSSRHMEVSFLIISLCTYYNRGEVDCKQSRWNNVRQKFLKAKIHHTSRTCRLDMTIFSNKKQQEACMFSDLDDSRTSIQFLQWVEHNWCSQCVCDLRVCDCVLVWPMISAMYAVWWVGRLVCVCGWVHAGNCHLMEESRFNTVVSHSQCRHSLWPGCGGESSSC